MKHNKIKTLYIHLAMCLRVCVCVCAFINQKAKYFPSFYYLFISSSAGRAMKSNQDLKATNRTTNKLLRRCACVCTAYFTIAYSSISLYVRLFAKRAHSVLLQIAVAVLIDDDPPIWLNCDCGSHFNRPLLA